MQMITRTARKSDVDPILQLTNHEVASGVALWDDQPRQVEQIEAWFDDPAKWPLLVAEDDGGTFLGFGRLGQFRPHSGYLHSTEHSLYITPEARGRGAGQMILEALIAEANKRPYRSMIGAIEAGNVQSIALHAKLGFSEVGRIPDIGRKFGRWLEVVLMHRLLPDPTISAD